MPAYRFNGYTVVGSIVSTTDENGAAIRAVLPQVQVVGAGGTAQPAGTAADPRYVQSPPLPGGTDRSGTATTTSGGLFVAANANRRGLVGQNVSGVSIGFNEFNGTAAIGSAGTYTVAAGQAFAISTSSRVNFIAASGTAAVTITEF